MDITPMLRIPTYVAPSPIAGMGVFSAVALRAGTVVWEYTHGVDWRIEAGELERFPEPYRSRLRHYLYRDDSGVYVLCGDNAKFMNHADDPNCDDSGERYTVTRRFVGPGEELTCDYRLFDQDARIEGLSFAESGV
ncbi:MAG: SET domain-containing protein-lysine N-methyltransferase [Longimicrobiales bacterium]|nr:SET domain-containing protein-lysine N-methyltransferase [Longimicrobiales bacterium]